MVAVGPCDVKSVVVGEAGAGVGLRDLPSVDRALWSVDSGNHGKARGWLPAGVVPRWQHLQCLDSGCLSGRDAVLLASSGQRPGWCSMPTVEDGSPRAGMLQREGCSSPKIREPGSAQ